MIKQGTILKNKNGDTVKVLGVCGEVYFISEKEAHDIAEGFYTEIELTKRDYTIPEEEWEPEKGDVYYYISGWDRVGFHVWNDDISDYKYRNFLGVYKTEKLAQKALADIKAKLGK